MTDQTFVAWLTLALIASIAFGVWVYRLLGRYERWRKHD